jgi:hypothetical protein
VLLVNVLGDSQLTVFLLASFPVVGLTALSNSPIGKRVQDRLEEQLPGVDILNQPRVLSVDEGVSRGGWKCS